MRISAVAVLDLLFSEGLAATSPSELIMDDEIESAVAAAGQAKGAEGHRYGGLEEAVDQTQPALLSLDVFDTLLWRGSEPTRRREAMAAEDFAAMLKKDGIAVRAEEILSARMLATRAAMSLRYVLDGQEDVQLETLFVLMLNALGLSQSWQGPLCEIELATEARCLTLNRRLADYTKGCRDKGTRVVMTSDTNLSAVLLTTLLRRMGASGCFDGVRTSADYGSTKRSGKLFRLLMEEERLGPDRIVHAGDDIVNDVGSPARLGIAVVHLPRRFDHRMMGRIRKGLSVRLHGTR